MSRKIALFVVFVLVSFRACGARSFGVIAEEFHNSVSQKNEKLNAARVSMQPDRKDSAQNDATRDITGEEISRLGKGEAGEPKYEHKIQAKGGRVEVSGTQRSELAKASVSWRVPPEKGGQPEPGFNLDYLPPQNPPSGPQLS